MACSRGPAAHRVGIVESLRTRRNPESASAAAFPEYLRRFRGSIEESPPANIAQWRMPPQACRADTTRVTRNRDREGADRRENTRENPTPSPTTFHRRLLHHFFLLQMVPPWPAGNCRPRPQCARCPVTRTPSETAPALGDLAQAGTLRDGPRATINRSPRNSRGLPLQTVGTRHGTCPLQPCTHRGRCRRRRESRVCHERLKKLRQPGPQSPYAADKRPHTLGSAWKHPAPSVPRRDRGGRALRSGKTGRTDGLSLSVRSLMVAVPQGMEPPCVTGCGKSLPSVRNGKIWG
jgi:hypothetical protein